MKVLITGITGFVGSHLAEFCLDRGDVEVIGTYRWRSPRDNIAHIKDLTLIEADILDASSCRTILAKVKPDWIFHLAAQSFVPTSWNAPSSTMTTNVVGQLNLFESLRELGALDTRFHVCGSSEEYGFVVREETPITEDNPLRPLSPYGVSKVAQDLLGYQYHRSYGLHTVRTRAFNHGGPRRGEVLLPSDFAKQIAEIEKGLREPVVRVGNLEALRDFTDVRDMVRAYWLALEKGTPGDVYNIGSGDAPSIQEVLDRLLALTDATVEVRQVPEKMRPSDVEILISDSSKFRSATGWEPKISVDQMLADTLDYWRERV
ncbi:MAG TPA: GDP-mannose 4,6-dehydratase [Actinomycetota bacterium]|nr:GDP-mannose 4,6-dehydratase [Actinomycetota bacterium]